MIDELFANYKKKPSQGYEKNKSNQQSKPHIKKHNKPQNKSK